ncbi:hypothetical protein MTO96_014245 [Rhipicephalus appendiculatus]
MFKLSQRATYASTKACNACSESWARGQDKCRGRRSACSRGSRAVVRGAQSRGVLAEDSRSARSSAGPHSTLAFSDSYCRRNIEAKWPPAPEDDWHSEAERDIAEEPAQVAVRNSSLECDLDVSVTVARSSYTAAAKRSGPFVDMPSEKSGLSLDEDTDPLDLSVSEGDDSLGQLSPMSQPLAPIPEEPELEAQLEMEHPPERNPEELSTHMEEEPVPLMLDALPIPDQELSPEAGNDLLPDSSEPKLQISEQSLAESAVLPEISDRSTKEDKATNTADVILIEDLPVRPRSPYQTRNRPHLSAHTQPSPGLEKLPPPPAESQPVPPSLSQRSQLGARPKVAPMSVEVYGARSCCPKGGHDTCTLTRDLMSIEGAQKQPEKCKKEEFGELFTKKSAVAGGVAPKSQAQSQTETEAESDDEDSMVDFDHLPIRSRMAIWKRREARAIRKGLAHPLWRRCHT